VARGTLKSCCESNSSHCFPPSPLQITMPVCVMKVIGVKILIVTNAAGGLNSEYCMGDMMVMTDHINLAGIAGFNPLIGHNDDRWGTLFVGIGNSFSCSIYIPCQICPRSYSPSDPYFGSGLIATQIVRGWPPLWQLFVCRSQYSECTHFALVLGNEEYIMQNAKVTVDTERIK